jgi:hypothetical protein
MSSRQARAERRAAAKVGSPPPKTKKTTPKTKGRGKQQTPLPDNSSVGSDDFEYSSSDSGLGAAPDTPASTVVTVASSASSARKNTKLAHNVEKQLLVDIQASGGIHRFDQGKPQGLNILLDKRPHIFGIRGDTLRRKIQQRVRYLRVLDKHKYQSLLDQYNITFGEAEASVSDLDEEPVFASPSNNYIHQKTPLPAKTSVKTRTSIPSSVSISTRKKVTTEDNMSHNPESRKYHLHLLFFVLLWLALFLSNKPPFHVPGQITVDIHRPENNYEFFIFDLGQTVEGVNDKKGKLFYGYDIYKKVDIRHVLDDLTATPFKARVSLDNQVLITLPAWDFSLLKLRDNFAGKINESEVGGLDDAHAKYASGEYGSKEMRRWAHYNLNFPKDHILRTDVIFAGAGEDQRCELKLIDIRYTDARVSPHPITEYYAKWTVACAHLGDRKKGKSEENAEDVSDAARLLQAMGIIPGGQPMNQG